MAKEKPRVDLDGISQFGIQEVVEVGMDVVEEELRGSSSSDQRESMTAGGQSEG